MPTCQEIHYCGNREVWVGWGEALEQWSGGAGPCINCSWHLGKSRVANVLKSFCLGYPNHVLHMHPNLRVAETTPQCLISHNSSHSAHRGGHRPYIHTQIYMYARHKLTTPEDSQQQLGAWNAVRWHCLADIHHRCPGHWAAVWIPQYLGCKWHRPYGLRLPLSRNPHKCKPKPCPAWVFQTNV